MSIESLSPNKFLELPQGKPGYIYLLKSFDKDGSFNYKIGYSKTISKRLSNLKTGNQYLELLDFFPTYNMRGAEKLFHKALKNFNTGGEFFKLDEHQLKIVRELFRDLNNHYRYWQKGLCSEVQLKGHLGTSAEYQKHP